MKTDRKVLRYKCSVEGLFGRNRKIKRESWTIGEDAEPDAPRTAEELLPAFRAKLAEVGFKAGIARIVEDPLTLLFSSRTIHTEGHGVMRLWE